MARAGSVALWGWGTEGGQFIFSRVRFRVYVMRISLFVVGISCS